MNWLVRYLRSSVGAKHVMAVTGLLMLLFAIVHMVGHLQMFGGPAMYNKYAAFLQNLWEVKWPVRVGLVGLLLLHVALALSLVARNRAARPVPYAFYRPMKAGFAGRSMALTGLMILAFLIFHIYHFTIAPTHHGDAFAMYVQAFRNVTLFAIYLVGMLLLSIHLGHGAAVWTQSLGFRHPKYPTEKLGSAIAALLFIGYMVPPTAVLVGIIR